MFSCLDISSLSQPCRSSSTTCRSRGRKYFSSTTHLFYLQTELHPDAKQTGTKNYTLWCLVEFVCTCFAKPGKFLWKNIHTEPVWESSSLLASRLQQSFTE